MVVKEIKPLSLGEVKNIVETIDKENEILSFLKKFSKLDEKKAKVLREELENLGLMKLKPEHIVKIIDFLPEDTADVNKIVADSSLDEDEINKILGVVKKQS